MGTTESIFYEDEEEEEEEEIEQEAPRHRHPAVSGQQLPPRSVPATPASAQPPPPQQRKPLPPALRISGILLGMPHSGRRTLLERLRGRDPFASPPEEGSLHEILAPYQPPPNQTAWERLQLHVQRIKRLSDVSKIDSSLDFCILLIDPRQGKEAISEFLSTALGELLTALGYHRQNHANNNGDGDAGQRKKEHGHSPPRPVCLCILRNFRDLESSRDEDRWISQGDLQQATLEALQDFIVEPGRLVLQSGSTSLYNCYGLHILHAFIYQAYLQRKQLELQTLLHQVEEAQRSSRALVSTVSYHDFLKHLRQPSVAPSNNAPKAASSSERRGKQQAVPPPLTRPGNSRASATTASTADSSYDQLDDSDNEANGQAALPPTAKDALEAFLADDDDEDDRPLGGMRKKGGGDDSDDEDDDDEFYYDESGRRKSGKQTKATPRSSTRTPSHVTTAKQDTANTTSSNSKSVATKNGAAPAIDALPRVTQPESHERKARATAQREESRRAPAKDGNATGEGMGAAVEDPDSRKDVPQSPPRKASNGESSPSTAPNTTDADDADTRSSPLIKNSTLSPTSDSGSAVSPTKSQDSVARSHVGQSDSRETPVTDSANDEDAKDGAPVADPVSDDNNNDEEDDNDQDASPSTSVRVEMAQEPADGVETEQDAKQTLEPSLDDGEEETLAADSPGLATVSQESRVTTTPDAPVEDDVDEAAPVSPSSNDSDEEEFFVDEPNDSVDTEAAAATAAVRHEPSTAIEHNEDSDDDDDAFVVEEITPKRKVPDAKPPPPSAREPPLAAAPTPSSSSLSAAALAAIAAAQAAAEEMLHDAAGEKKPKKKKSDKKKKEKKAKKKKEYSD